MTAGSTKTKRKAKTSKPKKSTARQLGVGKKAEAQSTESGPQSRWSSDVAELSSRTFATFDAALEAFIDKVFERMGKGGKKFGEVERKFLKDLFTTDPKLSERLKLLVNVKQG